MATYNTVRLMDYSNKFKEFELAAALYPGMMVELNSSGNVAAASEGSTNPQKMFLFERELLGEGLNTEIPSGEKAQVWYPLPGDEVYAVLADGENVSIGDSLAPDGTGKLQAATNSAAGDAVAIAQEALDLSGSSGAESEGPLGDYSKRIRAEVL